jgi:cytoskeletal protein CcmA (bactofilin family)
MLRQSGSKGKRSEFDGMLDRGSHIQGELRFNDEFVIRGSLQGSVKSRGELMIGEGGQVEGEIEVRRIVVSGTAKGVLRATENVHIAASGKVQADLFTPSLTIEEGAFFEGRCTMSSPKRDAERAPSENPKKVTQMPVAQRR